eukprot:TRINITY_DN5531_c0_g1_i1.p1 TRINITY_DN5531_c0_g1~~TRINITY_DN5531_c0_g1_i1.p1  ORF type:complete len:717 (+),score=139.03 TRINITY_DN5531_c0_g1_i1:19-2169(+)
MSELLISFPEGRVSRYERAFVSFHLSTMPEESYRTSIEKGTKAVWKDSFRVLPHGDQEYVQVYIHGVNMRDEEEIIGEFKVFVRQLIPYKPYDCWVNLEGASIRVLVNFEMMTRFQVQYPTYSNTGRLYIKVFRLKDPGPALSSKALLVCLKAGLMKVSTVPKPCDRNGFSWFEEFCIPVRTRDQSLEVAVKSMKIKKTTVGRLYFDLKKIPDGVEQDFWHKIKGDKDSTAELRIRIQYVPIAVTSYEGPTQSPPARININRIAYLPGDIVEGTVELMARNKKKIKSIDIEIYGYQKTKIDNPNSATVSSMICILYQSRNIFKQNDMSFNKKLPMGSYRWNFAFKLPKHLPPSFVATRSYKMSTTEYRLRLKFNGSKTPIFERIIRIYPRYDILDIPPLRPYKSGDNTLNIKILNCDYIQIDRDTPIRFSLKNTLAKPLKKLDITVKQVQSFRYYGMIPPPSLVNIENGPQEWGKFFNSANNTKIKVKEHVLKPEGWPLPPGEDWEGSINLHLLPNCAFTIPFNISPLYNIEYVITFKYDLGFLKKKYKHSERLFAVTQGLPAKPGDIDMDRELPAYPVETGVIESGDVTIDNSALINPNPSLAVEFTESTDSESSRLGSLTGDDAASYQTFEQPMDSQDMAFHFDTGFNSEDSEGNALLPPSHFPFLKNTVNGQNPFTIQERYDRSNPFDIPLTVQAPITNTPSLVNFKERSDLA